MYIIIIPRRDVATVKAVYSRFKLQMNYDADEVAPSLILEHLTVTNFPS